MYEREYETAKSAANTAGSVLGGAILGGPIQDRTPSDIEIATSRLTDIKHRLGSILDRINNTADRLYGPIPTCAANADKTEGYPLSQWPALMTEIDRVEATAIAIAEELSRLNKLA